MGHIQLRIFVEGSNLLISPFLRKNSFPRQLLQVLPRSILYIFARKEKVKVRTQAWGYPVYPIVNLCCTHFEAFCAKF